MRQTGDSGECAGLSIDRRGKKVIRENPEADSFKRFHTEKKKRFHKMETKNWAGDFAQCCHLNGRPEGTREFSGHVLERTLRKRHVNGVVADAVKKSENLKLWKKKKPLGL